MAPDPLILRPVTVDDAEVLLRWRNDPATRGASIDREPVSIETHHAWLTRSLSSADRILRVAEAGSEPVGVVRADRTTDGWALSWTVAPASRGRGIGSRMLCQFVATLEGRLIALIRRDNIASQRIALRAGLSRAAGPVENGLESWVREA